MRYIKFVVIICLLIGIPAQGDDLRHPSSLNSFCVDPARDELCADFPDDQVDFSDKFVYMLVNVETQTPFDVFSWQAFVSLNWRELGRASEEVDNSWQTFRRREQIFGNDIAMEKCAQYAEGADVITTNLVQADGSVLIDQSGNFVVYETRLNLAAERYIFDNALNTVAGQRLAEDRPVSFPQGSVGADPEPASVLIKTSWRIMPKGSDLSAHIVKEGLVHVPSQHTVTGQDMCVRETLGLVGMHIVSRIQSGNGDEWLWSTFEHHATAPTAGNTREVNSIYSRDLFPGGCSAPSELEAINYGFFDPDCPDCPTNQSPSGDWRWAEAEPYARIDGDADFTPPQIVRCWNIFEGTRELNDIWHDELRGTALENYILISTQWRGADKSPLFEHGEVPRFLTNTTMETYLQAEQDGTCLGCHAGAETATGKDANFTFLLRDAQ